VQTLKSSCALVVALALGLLPAPANAQVCTAWEWANPLPSGNDILAIAHGGGLFAAVGARGTILTSPDGETWTFRDSGTWNDFRDIAWNGERFVAVGRSPAVSTDGIAWVSQPLDPAGDLAAVVWTGRQFVAVGDVFAYSRDGTSWATTAPVIPWGGIVALAWDGYQFAGATGSGVFTSPDGGFWTLREPGKFDDVIWTGEQFVAAGALGTIATSPDGATWTQVVHDFWAPPLPAITSLTWTGQGYAGATSYGEVVLSKDLKTWQRVFTSSTPQAPHRIVWGGGTFVAAGSLGALVSSNDGITWRTHSSGLTADFTRVRWTGTEYIAVGLDYTSQNVVATSRDGLTWSASYPPAAVPPAELIDVTRGAPGYVAVGAHKTIAFSGDGRTWQTVASGPPDAPQLNSVTWGGGRFVAVGSAGTVLTSPDGQSWSHSDPGTSDGLLEVAWTGAQYVAVGGRLPDITIGYFCLFSTPTILTSADAIAWRHQDPPTNGGALVALAWTGRDLVALVQRGSCSEWPSIRSSDGVQWAPQEAPAGTRFNAIAWCATFLGAVGWEPSPPAFLPYSVQALWVNSDGVAWTKAPGWIPAAVSSIASDGRSIVAVGRRGTILRTECAMPSVPRRHLQRVNSPRSGGAIPTP
jgi:hypothetical protein